MKNLSMSILSFFLLTACSSTHFINNDETSFNEVNKKLEGRNVTLELITDEEISGYNVKVKSDSTTVEDGKISTNTIKEITYNNHGMGALKGLGYGLIGGASFGFLMGYITHSSQNGMLVPDSPAESGLMVATAFGGIVAITGLLVGAIHGDVEDFIFLSAEESIEKIRVEISSVVEETDTYIIVLYQNNSIHLNKSEYNSVDKTDDGKHLIVVPKSIYLRRFK